MLRRQELELGNAPEERARLQQETAPAGAARTNPNVSVWNRGVGERMIPVQSRDAVDVLREEL